MRKPVNDGWQVESAQIVARGRAPIMDASNGWSE